MKDSGNYSGRNKVGANSMTLVEPNIEWIQISDAT